MAEVLVFLGILDQQDIEWLVAHSMRQDVQSGTVVIRRGEPVEFLYLVVDGAFDVTVPVPNERKVATVYPGELMGEMSFVDAHLASATVTAGLNSRVLAINKGDLNAKIENDLGFAARFYRGISRLLSHRLRAAYSDKPDLRADGERADKMGTLAMRFEEIRLHLESRRHAQGA